MISEEGVIAKIRYPTLPVILFGTIETQLPDKPWYVVLQMCPTLPANPTAVGEHSLWMTALLFHHSQ